MNSSGVELKFPRFHTFFQALYVLFLVKKKIDINTYLLL